MTENTRLTGIELNGQLYSLGKAIYEELGMSLERFAELLGRDLYCPTLSEAPTSSTLTYTDTDGETHHFQTGQPCRWMEEDSYRMAICKDIVNNASAWYIFPATIVSAEDLSAKQDKGLKFENLTASVWVEDSTFLDYPYRCDIACEGVTQTDYAEVVFALEQATSGLYAPLCATSDNVVSVWSSSDASVIVPTVIITK
ncbi:MAG: hypothetical protein IJA95_07510 [Bacteroidaceae bacterium]|nr:hypothetical protein [Bacteroidaceae bacterium]